MKLNKDLVLSISDKVLIWSVCALVLSLPFSKAAIEVSAAIAILAFIIKRAALKDFLPKTPINNVLILLVLAAGLSIVFSTNPALSLRTFFRKFLEFILIYLVVFDAIKNKKIRDRVLAVFFLSVALVAIDGIFQFFTHIDFLRMRPWPYDIRPFTFRITGPFKTSNGLGAYLLPLSVLSFATFQNLSKNRVLNRSLKALPFILIVCLFLTLSRGALLGLGAGLLFMSVFVDKKLILKIILIFTVFLMSVWFMLPDEKRVMLKTRLSLSDPGGRDRKELNKISLRMIKDKPVFGLGIGTYMHNFEKYNLDKKAYPWGPSYAHNCYLQTAAETGLFGLFAFLSLIAVLFVSSIRKTLRGNIKPEQNLSFLLLASLFAYLIHCVFDTHLYNLDIAMIFWIFLGLSQAQLKFIKN